MKLATIAGLLAALALAASAAADDYAGLWMSAGSSGSSRLVTFTVKLAAAADSAGPGGSVVFKDCKAGLGLPLPVEPSSYVKPAGTSLYANKLGDLQWNFDRVPPRHSAKPLTLKLTYAVPRHARPYSVCLRAEALQNASGIRLASNMRFFLLAAKKK